MSALPRVSVRSALGAALAASVLMLSACTATPPTVGTPSPSGDGQRAVTTGDRVQSTHEVEPGRSLAIACWGEGSPTVVYDAGTGTSGIETLSRAAPVTALASTTRVCTYDRAGIGQSDPPPDRPRTVDDLVDDLDALLTAAEIAPPYVLVGSSGGGFDVYHYAGVHPDDVAGMVMDDVPAPQADMSPGEVPAWDSAENVENMDYVRFEYQLAAERLPIPAVPVTVLWATNGQSPTQGDQALWLEGSSAPVSVAVESGHDIMHGNPAAVADAIEKMLAALEG